MLFCAILFYSIRFDSILLYSILSDLPVRTYVCIYIYNYLYLYVHMYMHSELASCLHMHTQFWGLDFSKTGVYTADVGAVPKATGPCSRSPAPDSSTMGPPLLKEGLGAYPGQYQA